MLSMPLRSRQPGFIYVVQMGNHPLYKIGRSSNVPRRMSEIGIQLPFPYRLCFAHHVGNTSHAEANIHRQLVRHRKNGEWFELRHSALAYIQTLLLCTQAKDLADRLVQQLSEDTRRGERLAKYGRLLIQMEARINRRKTLNYQAAMTFGNQRLKTDGLLSAEIVV